MNFQDLVFFIFIAFTIHSPLQILAEAHSYSSLHGHTFKALSPFSTALEILQNQTSYKFQNIGLLRRAMTHSSYSEENNRALSILGTSVIETTISFRALNKDIDMPAKDLNRRIADISKIETCAVDGMRLGLQKIVRVSPKTDPSTPTVVCSAFRAIFGAIAIDSGKPDDAGVIFGKVHDGYIHGGAVAI